MHALADGSPVCLPACLQSTRERLDALADMQKAAAEARQQQQGRIDGLDCDLQDLRTKHTEQIGMLEVSSMRKPVHHACILMHVRPCKSYAPSMH